MKLRDLIDTVNERGKCVASPYPDAWYRAEPRRILLVDTADPKRSGLAHAAQTADAEHEGPHETVQIRTSHRGNAVIACLETKLSVLPPGIVPPPRFWLPADNEPPHITVVDLVYDAWRLAAQPLSGAGAWLRNG
jgi:hypothetical protein